MLFKRKFFGIMACAICIALSLLCIGCSNADDPQNGDNSTVSMGENATDFVPVDFSWKSHVWSDIYSQAYGKDMKNYYYGFVDALMSGEKAANALMKIPCI